MSRWHCGTCPLTVVLATVFMPSAWAQDGMMPARFAAPAQQASHAPVAPAGVVAGVAVDARLSQPGYVQLGAPLYPAPRPNIPVETGITFITNQALAPHEFLYPHTYRSMHGPYYHRVVGGYYWTPFGMRTHERWELQGTMVTVKYRSQQPFFKRMASPTTSMWGGAWE